MTTRRARDDVRLAVAASLRALLPGVELARPAVWVGGAPAVLAAGVAGAAGPARRVARADPARVLAGS